MLWYHIDTLYGTSHRITMDLQNPLYLQTMWSLPMKTISQNNQSAEGAEGLGIKRTSDGLTDCTIYPSTQ